MTGPEDRVLKATGRPTLASALYWIASDAPLTPGTDRHRLLRDLSVVAPDSADGEAAIRRMAREVTQSGFDSASILLRPDTIRPASDFRAALEALAQRCPGKSLANIDADAFIAAASQDAFVVEALCAVAGMSYSDLRDRAPSLPTTPDAPWTHSKFRAAFKVISEAVEGTGVTGLTGAIPARPLDLMTGIGAPSGHGWAAVEAYFRHGVPYEVLLAQRAAGGAWLAHRNTTSAALNHPFAEAVCARLDQRKIGYRRSTNVGGTIQPSVVQDLAGSDAQTGVVVLDAHGQARYAIVFASAKDSGTARTSAARLRAMRRDPSLPMAIVVTGGGWSRRNETADLAKAFEGRLFSETGLDALVADIEDAVRGH